MTRILIIDDEEDSILPIRKELDKQGSVKTEYCGFDQAKCMIRCFLPNVIILDLICDSADGTPETEQSKMIDEFIWDERFCPLIVYSAEPDLYDGEHATHPFVKTVKKGSLSVDEVIETLDQLKPLIEALEETEEYVRVSLARTLREAAPYAVSAFPNATDDAAQTIIRLGKRRLIAELEDVFEGHESKIKGWEMYLCPPVSEDIQSGDILRDATAEQEQPASFRLVLSPSCDMVQSGGRSAKISDVLVARCCSVQKALSCVNLGRINNDKLDASRLGLSRGYIERIVHLPSLPGRIPTMAADVKDLELVPIDQIATRQAGDTNSARFLRVASVDSPFREAFTWAFLQTAGRPGLPDRDFVAWIREIKASRNRQ